MAQGLLQKSVSLLNHSVNVDNTFVVHYAELNPRVGSGSGSHSLRCKDLLESYVTAINTFCNFYSNETKRLADSYGIINFYLLDVYDGLGIGSPFTDTDKNAKPYVVLPSRSFEPTMDSLKSKARADAIHELTHVLNYMKRPHDNPYSYPWFWYDEGMAMYMESKLLAQEPDYLRYMSYWCDYPHIPLDSPDNSFCSAMFLHFIAEHFGFDMVREIWNKAEEKETPFTAMNRIINKKSKNKLQWSFENFFAEDYCVRSFFPGRGENHSFSTKILERFGKRTISESLELKSSATSTDWHDINRLSCRYFRIIFKHRDPVKITCRVPNNYQKMIHATTVLVKENGEPEKSIKLKPVPKSDHILTADLNSQNLQSADHIIVVVINTCSQKIDHSQDEELYDRIPIQIHARIMANK